MSEQSDNLPIPPVHQLSARPSMILEEPSLSVKGNWMQQANQRLLLRMARFTEEDKQRMLECLHQCRLALIQSNQVSLNGENISGLFVPKLRLKRKNEESPPPNGIIANNETSNCDINMAIKSKFWTFSRKQLKQSLIRSTKKDIDKAAIKLFQIITSYANRSFRLESDSDSDTSLKANHQTRLIQSLLEKVLSYDELRDEIYLQLIKQTTDNNDIVGGTNHKYWQILSVVCNVVKPRSQQIFNYLESHFKICGIDSTTEEGRYSIYCQKCLIRTTDKLIRVFIASTKEINAVIRRQCIKLRIYLLDGSFRKIEVYSHTPNAEMFKMMKNKVGLKQETVGWSIFEQIGNVEKHCNSKELVSDMIFRWESLRNSGKFTSKIYLIYKKRIFEENLFNKSDPVEIKLLTHQCISDIFEDCLKINNSQAAEICALRQIQEGCDACISLRILPRYMRPNINMTLISQIESNIKNQSNFTIENCYEKILNVCKTCDPFGAFHFPVSQYSMTIWPTEIILSINRKGLYFAAKSSASILLFLRFADVTRFTVQTMGFLTVSVRHQKVTELKMFSNMADDISSLIRDYMVDQTLADIKTSSWSSSNVANTYTIHLNEPCNSTEASNSSNSMASLPISCHQSKLENKNGVTDGIEIQNENQGVKYLKEYFDTFSIQSDDVFVLKDSQNFSSSDERRNKFDFSAQIRN